MFSNSSIKKIVSAVATSCNFKYEQINPSLLDFHFRQMCDNNHFEIIVTKFKNTYSLGFYLVDENSDFIDTFDKIYEYYSNLDQLCYRIQYLIDVFIHNCK